MKNIKGIERKITRVKRAKLIGKRSILSPGGLRERPLCGCLGLFLFLYMCLPEARGLEQANDNGKVHEPPPIKCNPDSDTVDRGGTVKIKIPTEGVGLIYSFGSSAGTLVVRQNEATLNTVGVDAKTIPRITVVCSAVDSTGQTVQASATVSLRTEPALMVRKTLVIQPPKDIGGYTKSATIAPSLSWTTGTQSQTIAGGTALFSAVHSNSYCDAQMIQFGLVANASNTGTTKIGASTINLDNNDVKLDATMAVGGRQDPAYDRDNKHKLTNDYLGVAADFFGNNSLGIGLQQTYALEYQHYLRDCTNDANSAHRLFASFGIGAGFMNQRLYKTTDKLNEAILPLSSQFSYLLGEKPGMPPKLMAYGLLGYLPVLTDMHAYQLSAIAGLQIPTKFSWLTITLTESDLYMNNAPVGSKRNYQNGSVALAFTFPGNPPKLANPEVPEGDKGACYGGDKLARLYCYDDVTVDACTPPNLFRRKQHCSSAGSGAIEPVK
jgi:hypothetical protein